VADFRRSGQHPAPGLLEDADRHHDHRLAGEHELLLGEERRLVVEQLVEEVLLLEDELAGEEDDVRESAATSVAIPCSTSMTSVPTRCRASA